MKTTTIDPEAQGVLARIALVDCEIERHAADLKAATAAHWQHYFEHELFDALRRKDRFEERLAHITNQRKTT